MKTDRAAGETVGLRIVAAGSVTIDGATGTLEQGQYAEYTLTSQTVSIHGDVTELSCYNIDLTELDVSRAPTLIMLSCDGNLLKTLDLSKNTALAVLNCPDNQLTSLDISQNTILDWLECSRNKLTDLDVTKNPELTSLSCSENLLTSLNPAGCTKLTEIYCHGNRLEGDAMGRLINSLSRSNEGELYIIDTKNTEEKNICTKPQVEAAKVKGWKVYDFNGSRNNRQEYPGSETAVGEIVAPTVSVYPNPAKDFAIIEGAGMQSEFRIYNIEGRPVLFGRVGTSGSVRLDLSSFARGVYLLQIAGRNYKLLLREDRK